MSARITMPNSSSSPRHLAGAVVGLAAALAAAATVARAAPVAVPEYAPTRTVMLSADLFPYGYKAPELVLAVREAGAEVLILGETAQAIQDARAAVEASSIAGELAKQGGVRWEVVRHGNLWLRDYGPWPVVDVAPDPKKAPRLGLVDFTYGDGVASAEDLSVRLGKAWDVPVTRVPAAVDGGNLLAVGRKRGGVSCLAATLANVTEATAKTDEVVAGLLAFGKSHLAAAGCDALMILDGAAHAHVDMFVKAVADDTVLVSQVLPETLEVARGGGPVTNETPQAIATELAALTVSLDRSAEQLAAAGLKVTRIPLPLPYRGAFRTFANALLVNGTALVPSYARYAWGYDDYPDRALEASYETAVRQAYEAHGFRVRFLNADGMIYNGGAFHCVSTHVPALSTDKQ
jgi:agmatine/peptidylarginine deiminase